MAASVLQKKAGKPPAFFDEKEIPIQKRPSHFSGNSHNRGTGIAQTKRDQYTREDGYTGSYHPKTPSAGKFLGQIKPHQPQNRNRNSNYGSNPFDNWPCAHTTCRKQIQKKRDPITNEHFHHNIFHLAITIATVFAACHGPSLQDSYRCILSHSTKKCNPFHRVWDFFSGCLRF